MNGSDGIKPQINYEQLVENALKDVVRSALAIAQKSGLPGECHFFITFLTDHDGVSIPDRLRESHPEKMTIIIQHQFWDLQVDKEHFEITLSFGGQKEHLIIPFMAITEFNDPSVGFGLQFSLLDDNDDGDGVAFDEDADNADEPMPKVSADVVSLDTFRKKN